MTLSKLQSLVGKLRELCRAVKGKNVNSLDELVECIDEVVCEVLDPLSVVLDPVVCGGELVVKGTSVPLRLVVELLRKGMSPEGVQRYFPSVPLDVIRKIKEKLDRKEPIIALVKLG